MFTLIENGEIYAPEYMGAKSILLAGGKIVKIGEVDAAALARLDLGCETVDASGCVVTPGFLDPHEHILGAGGEEGFMSRTPEVPVEQIVGAGITTVVGCLGTDSTTRHLSSLVGRARQMQEQGLTTYIYTGNFRVPPVTITSSVTDDMVLIDKIIGVGEIAISDFRSLEPTVLDIARLVSDAILGGLLSGKAGVTHFHTGPGSNRLGKLHETLDRHEIPPRYLYPTHVNRTEELLDDAIAFSKRGAFVDIDTTEEGLGKWIERFLDNGGPPDRLTVSSDAHAIGTQLRLHEEFAASATAGRIPLERLLPLFTLNTASALQLGTKGRLQTGMDADVLVMKKDGFSVSHVFAGGKPMVKDGKVLAQTVTEK